MFYDFLLTQVSFIVLTTSFNVITMFKYFYFILLGMFIYSAKINSINFLFNKALKNSLRFFVDVSFFTK